MDEDLFDLLVIDEASQVSIAESISLILRAQSRSLFLGMNTSTALSAQLT
jgi:superfamily I DNA and/or RNA helicase